VRVFLFVVFLLSTTISLHFFFSSSTSHLFLVFTQHTDVWYHFLLVSYK
jgi:hypothetical protein